MTISKAGLCRGWLGGGGEMGARMRAKDWPGTPRGLVETWPESSKSWISEPIRACQLGDLRWSTLLFGDGNEILSFAQRQRKKPRHDARQLK
jgi:hypothetical protein